MTNMKSDALEVTIADAWALAEVLRHRAPCAVDCEYCGHTEGERPDGTGYRLAQKVQQALLQMQEKKAASVTITIDEHEAWMIYRYLPSNAYDGAREFLLKVFGVITGLTGPTDLPSWAQDLDLN